MKKSGVLGAGPRSSFSEPGSERILQRKLNQPGGDRRLADYAQVRSAGEEWPVVGEGVLRGVPRKRELRMVEDVEELGAELNRLSFADLHDLARLEVKVQLVRPAHDADAGVAETCRPVVAHHRRRAERGRIEEASGA